MAANHFVVDGCRDVVHRELATFLRHLCVEDYLKQQIAELVAEFRGPAFPRFFDCFESFVRLLEKHWGERGVGLLAVPGAAVWRT